MREIKRVIYILIVIFVVGGGFWLWRTGRKNEIDVKTSQDQIQTKESFEYLTDGRAMSPVLAHDNLSIWYFDENGELLRQHLEKKDDLKKFPLPEHSQINFAIWPDKGADFIIGTSDGRFWYDSKANIFMPYPKEVKYMVWMPGGQRVAYIWDDGKEVSLSVAKSNLIDHKVIARLSHSNFHFSVSPNGRSFIFYSASGSEPLYLVLDGIGILESVSDKAAVLSAQFGPDGKTVAYVLERDGDKYLHTLDLSSSTSTMVGTIMTSNGFAWGASGNLYWSDSSRRIRKSHSEQPVIDKEIVAEEIIISPDEKELFFVEDGMGRLRRILVE